MASVKRFDIKREPSSAELGVGRFIFTDKYSVFDWGPMPDTIPHKGASLCVMGAHNFELLAANDIPTHYRGVSRQDDTEATTIAAHDEPPTQMEIDLAQVPELSYLRNQSYDYATYHERGETNYVIPLEIVFRNRVPVGSSLRSRREPAHFDLPLDEWPQHPVDLPKPIVEFSTKFEEQDRYVTRDEAAEIAGIANLDRLEEIAKSVNEVLTAEAQKRGFTHEDGKIECLFHDGIIKVADVVGTFDENRFTYDGVEISKEAIRQYYKSADTEWVNAVSDAKRSATEADTADWRTLCKRHPTPLPDHVVEIASTFYAAGANQYTGTQWFDAPHIESVIEDIEQIIQ
jgi:phosphoribosylaminoimidazole-succinocarboxamide synthase